MIKLKPQFIKDTAGKQLVILSKKEYDAIIDELEEAEDVFLFDQAKKDTSEKTLFSDYLKKRNKK